MHVVTRAITCGMEFVRGRVYTLCGVEIEIDWTKHVPVEEVVTCELCIAEMERRWLEPSH